MNVYLAYLTWMCFWLPHKVLNFLGFSLSLSTLYNSVPPLCPLNFGGLSVVQLWPILRYATPLSLSIFFCLRFPSPSLSSNHHPCPPRAHPSSALSLWQSPPSGTHRSTIVPFRFSFWVFMTGLPVPPPSGTKRLSGHSTLVPSLYFDM